MPQLRMLGRCLFARGETCGAIPCSRQSWQMTVIEMQPRRWWRISMSTRLAWRTADFASRGNARGGLEVRRPSLHEPDTLAGNPLPGATNRVATGESACQPLGRYSP